MFPEHLVIKKYSRCNSAESGIRNLGENSRGNFTYTKLKYQKSIKKIYGKTL